MAGVEGAGFGSRLTGMNLAIIGAGWAGLAASVAATKAGCHVTVFEASRTFGGRARAVPATMPDGTAVLLDNGQHILIGAYRETLKVMTQVGVNPLLVLHSQPLALKFPDGNGVEFPNWPSPVNALAGIFGVRAWRMADKFSLLLAALKWQWNRFNCPDHLTVAQLCRGITPKIMVDLIEPLCVSALNTPAQQASAQVFLRVMKDSLFGAAGGSDLLLPKQDLSTLFPNAAAEWLTKNGGRVRLGTRVEKLFPDSARPGWRVDGQRFDAVIVAGSAPHAVQLLSTPHEATPDNITNQIADWTRVAASLQFEAITTVYACSTNAALPHPMLALHSGVPGKDPAQFVFDRGQLGGPCGLLAFVVSASNADRQQIEAQVLAQAKSQLGMNMVAVQTIVEKRATFACTPGLVRPATRIAPGLYACGDYCDGPYPATLEGAVKSGLAAVEALKQERQTHEKPSLAPAG